MWWSCNYAVTNGQTEGPMMSLSASEQQALDSIEATLTSADPKLVSLLATFARLASGEEMPVRERVRIHRRATSNTRPATQTAMLRPR